MTDEKTLFNGPAEDDNEPKNGKVKLEATIGLFSGVTIIVGSIIGSGIFISPKGVHEQAHSVGLSLLIWILCGVFSTLGAYCYAELGVMIRKSGGDYAYIMEAFGPFLAFVRLWIEAIVVRPCSATVVALTFAVYLLRPIFPHCDTPDYAPQLLAVLCLTLLTFVNCWSVRLSARVQDVFTVAKVVALIIIILTGIVMLCLGHTSEFENSFDGSSRNPGEIAMAFYSGLFAYNGWNYLNFIVEELKNPKRNLPLSIGISMVLVTVIYVMTNIAFYTVVSADELLDSPAVAVSFAGHLYGSMAWVMPIFVACSTFGSANGVILTSSRLFHSGAREGHMPEFLTLINYQRLTPIPAVVFTAAPNIPMASTLAYSLLFFRSIPDIMLQGFLSILYLALSDNLYSLITFIQIVNWLAIAGAIAALLYLRKSQPDAPRPIKVNLAFPIIFMAGCIFLVVVPLVAQPKDTMIGLSIMLTSVPVYLLCIKYKHKQPLCVQRFTDSLTMGLQKGLLGVLEKSD